MDGTVIDLIEHHRTAPEAVFYGTGQWSIAIAKLGGGTVGRKYEGIWLLNCYKFGELKTSERIRASGNHLEVVLGYDEKHGYLND